MDEMSEEERQQLEALKRVLFLRILDEGARNRLNNIRAVNREFAEQVEMAIMQLVQSGRVKQVSEEQLIQLIKRLRGPTRETRIVRR